MKTKYGLTNIVNLFCFFLLFSSANSFSGIADESQYDYDEWGFNKSDYGKPNPDYGYKVSLVTKVQKKLKYRNYDPGTIDGSWGDLTRNTLILFQEELGIKKTGWIDLKTRDLLFGKVNFPVNLVKRAQEMLQANGFSPGPIDGLWGEQTENALKQYQKKNNLRESGLLDIKTIEILLKE